MATTPGLGSRPSAASGPAVTAASIEAAPAQRSKRRWLAAAAAITLFAFAVRLLRLDFVNFHSDEAHFIRIAYEGTLLQATAYDDPHPPLFLAMLQAWMGAAGVSQVGIRMLPMLFGTLMVPALYQLGRLLAGRRLGITAAFVAAANPAFIFYAKEVRNNGLLAVAGTLSFALLLLALRRPKLLPAYVLAALAALYSHYYDIPLIALQLLVGAIWLLRRGNLRLWPWGAAPVALLIGFAPWLLYARSTIANYNAGRGSLQQVWAVLAETYSALSAGFAVPAGDAFWPGVLMGGLLLIGLAGSAAMHRNLLTVAVLYALAPVAFGALTLVRQTNFNPRYLFAGAPGYALIVAAAVVFLWRWHWVAGGLAGVFLLSLTGLTVRNTDFTAEFQPNGYRQMAAYLARHAVATDSMVLDGTSQWPLYFYYGQLQEHLPQRVEFLPLDTAPATDFAAQRLLTGNVWYIESDVDRYDPAHIVEALLAKYGFQAYDGHFGGQRLEYFAGPAAGAPVPVDTRFGSLHLVAAAGGGREFAAGSVVGAGLNWRREGEPVRPFKSSLRLERNGTVVAQNDTLPQAGHLDFAGWADGQTVSTRPGLRVPVGTIPGTYQFRLLTYDASSGASLGPALELADVTVTHAAPQNPAAADLPAIGVDVDGVRLEAAGVSANSITPGERAPITLLWSGSRTTRPVNVTLAVGRERLDHVVGGDTYPTTAWQPADVVRDVLGVRIPPDLAAGVYPVKVGDRQIGSLRVLPVERSFSPPPLAHRVSARFGDVAELLGYEIQLEPGTIHVRLVWQALGETEAPYAVFVHALDASGRVAGQVDLPLGSERWVTGQVISTTYDVPVSDADRLDVGLYDPASGRRLALAGGADGVILPLT